ncbi:RHS repeat-associated core domain-containing protein [Dactylosporangium sp. NPDC000521]|uniref:RHS repeat-associated core domain-containing protein n=1 Tax=Dactylosporangium sp. NPDC000521 TaxID=3363975 RepID=UPI0036AD271B
MNRSFLNKQNNTSTGLLDVGAREYDPDLGMFLSPDPLISIGQPESFNAYAYAHHTPISKSDTTGLRPDCEGECLRQWSGGSQVRTRRPGRSTCGPG